MYKPKYDKDIKEKIGPKHFRVEKPIPDNPEFLDDDMEEYDDVNGNGTRKFEYELPEKVDDFVRESIGLKPEK